MGNFWHTQHKKEILGNLGRLKPSWLLIWWIKHVHSECITGDHIHSYYKANVPVKYIYMKMNSRANKSVCRCFYPRNIYYHRTDNYFLSQKKKFLQFSIVRLHQCPLFNSNTAVKQGDKMYTDLINQEKIRHISVIIRGSP